MDADAIIVAIRSHDWTALAGLQTAPAEAIARIESLTGQLDAESRSMAVEVAARVGTLAAARLLLTFTGDDDLSVAGAAARKLAAAPLLPPAAEIGAAIASRANATVRGQIYLAWGRTDDPTQLDHLRGQAATESRPEAQWPSQAAAVRLGGGPERLTFATRISATTPQHAMQASEQILYVGDISLAKALLPWFRDSRPVLRIGSDANPRMARMCDIATYTAHRLGVRFAMHPGFITVFDAEIIQAAEQAVTALADAS